MLKSLSVGILTATLSVTAVRAEGGATPSAARDTANSVSLDLKAPNFFGHFAPELGQTLARMPQIDPETGIYVEEVKPNLFYITDGIYNSGFVRTGDGIIVFDAPASFGEKLPSVIEAHASGEPIRYLLYSHGHTDHVGGSNAFAGVEGLRIVAPASVAEAMGGKRHPGILTPNVTFDDEYEFSLGREAVEIRTAHFHSEDADAIIYLPRQKFVVAVDTITPGEVPFMNFGATSRLGGYVEFFDEILQYDFDTILTGHLSILGTREDVILNRDYVYDVRETALAEMPSMLPTFEEIFAAFGHQNGNLAYRAAMERIRQNCSTQIMDRWKDRLSVVDVWADSHCETAIVHAIMH